MLPEEALLLSLAAVLDEDELPLPNRPLHQPPPELPELLALSLGASGSGAGSGPALTTTLTRVLSLADAPSPGDWLMMVPAGWSLYCSVWPPRPSFFCTSRVRASFTLMPMRLGTLVVVATCGRLT